MHHTLWTQNLRLPPLPGLQGDAECDVCVVGAGIAGLSTAHRLAEAGLDVILLERDQVASGETHHTSAHLASEIDDCVFQIARRLGDDAARMVVESHASAIDWIEAVVAREGIDCDFRRVPGYLFLAAGQEPELLDREHAAARAAGLDVHRLERAPVPSMDVGPCLSFARQGQFHPVRFLLGLSEAFRRRGGRMYRAHVVDVEDGEPCVVEALHGSKVRAASVLLATNSPSNAKVVTMKMVPYRTFLVAMRAAGDVPEGLFWDTAEPYHYVRVVQDAEGPLVLSGGGDYQTGRKDEGERVWSGLEEWTRARFPVGTTEWRWSGQVLEPADWLAFIGRLHRDGHVYVCTGDSGQGLTHGVICALLVGDLVHGRSHPWEDLYSPGRLTPSAAGEYAADVVKIGRSLLDWLLPGEVSSEEHIPPGHGAVMRDGARLLAVHRDDQGVVQRRSAVCTHAGCIVHWDSSARIWACPCHGSRFDPRGEVINGPATEALAPAEPPAGPRDPRERQRAPGHPRTPTRRSPGPAR